MRTLLLKIRFALKALLLPPTSLFVIGIFGALLFRKWRRLGGWMMGLSAALMLALHLPLVAGPLLMSLQTSPALDLEQLEPGPEAIVVLSADVVGKASELGTPDVGSLTLQRVRYAARLAKASGLPILVSGGSVAHSAAPIADSMRRVLEHEFGVEVRWSERRSGNTRTNAVESAAILKGEGVNLVYLVTHAWHMPRARMAFEAVGLAVVPAPTAFRERTAPGPGDFIPSVNALRDSCWAIHEWLGRAWYALRV